MSDERSYRGVQVLALTLIGFAVLIFVAGLQAELQQRKLIKQLPAELAQLANTRALGLSGILVDRWSAGLLSMGLGIGLLVCRDARLDAQLVKRAIGRVLAATPPGTSVLVAAFNDVNGAIWAAESLAEVSHPSIAELFVKHLEDPSPVVRHEVARLLQRSNWQPSNERQQAFLHCGLGNVGKAAEVGAAGLDALVVSAQTKSQRKEAIEALSCLGAIAVNPLIDLFQQCLASSDWQGVAMTAKSLGALGTQAASAVHILSEARGSSFMAATTAQALARESVNDALKKIQTNMEW